MNSVNRRSLLICMITCTKKLSLIKNVSINLSEKINNLIAQDLLSVVDHVKSSNGYKNEKKLQLIN